MRKRSFATHLLVKESHKYAAKHASGQGNQRVGKLVGKHFYAEAWTSATSI